MSGNSHNTIAHLIHNVKNVEDRGVVFVESADSEMFCSYKMLYQDAIKMAYLLTRKGMSQGDELVFQLTDNRTFITTFWACVLTGIIPVPLSVGISAEQKQKLSKVWTTLTNPSLIADEKTANKINDQSILAKLIMVHEMETSSELELSFPTIEPKDIAFVQFSSGSTGSPKGVTLTHGNLLTNVSAIHAGIDSPDEGDSFFSWMPLTHDMGLIGFHLTPLQKGWTHYIMPTSMFIRNPILCSEKFLNIEFLLRPLQTLDISTY
ncbi:MAG: AMP-binding protein [Flavobacteriales bacterium]|nr:AMP-binding protein [Flavobacteriales bacterium]